MSLVKPLLSYEFFEELTDFVKAHLQKRKYFFPGYVYIYPKLNQSLNGGTII